MPAPGLFRLILCWKRFAASGSSCIGQDCGLYSHRLGTIVVCMGLTVCPTAIVAAPLAVVWGNLVQWERYAGWADVQPERVEPAGPAAAGQTIHFAGKALALTLRFVFKVEAIDPDRHQIDLHVFF